MPDSAKKFPDDCIQALGEQWWCREADPRLRRGRLLRAMVPFTSQQPYVLIPEGRNDPTEHSEARYKVKPLRVVDGLPRAANDHLPVAALPEIPGEGYVALRGKIRPVIIVSTGGPDLPPALRVGSARSQTAPMLLVVPTFGADRDGKRGGINAEFAKRIRRCEYPHFIWDRLPLPGAEESIIRLDHLMPIARHENAYRVTDWCLTPYGLDVFDEWVQWLLTGTLPKYGNVLTARELLCKLP